MRYPVLRTFRYTIEEPDNAVCDFEQNPTELGACWVNFRPFRELAHGYFVVNGQLITEESLVSESFLFADIVTVSLIGISMCFILHFLYYMMEALWLQGQFVVLKSLALHLEQESC